MTTTTRVNKWMWRIELAFVVVSLAAGVIFLGF